MKRFLFLSILTSAINLFAQDSDSLTIDKKGFLRLHFLIPGIDYEQPLSNNFTLKFALQSGVGYRNTTGWEFTPYATAEQRYYFSSRKRRNYPKRDKYFSTLYLSLQENYFFKTSDFVIGPVIGYQFTFARIWYFDLGLGPGYNINNQEFYILAIGNISIGLVLDFF